jgi:hypothetical protein
VVLLLYKKEGIYMFDVELSKDEIDRILFWLSESLGLESDEEENDETILLMTKLTKILED